jgi:hypothetical protein
MQKIINFQPKNNFGDIYGHFGRLSKAGQICDFGHLRFIVVSDSINDKIVQDYKKKKKKIGLFRDFKNVSSVF